MTDDEAFARRLAGHRVLLCYGIFGEVMAGLRRVGIDYMARQLAWLRAIGVEAAPVGLPTVAPVEQIAEGLAALIAASPAPVVVVAHSKGGLDALSALLRPGVAARCRGFLALQSPFHGSPLADAALGFGPLRHVAHHALRLARLGDGDGLRDLTCAVREPWMAAQGEAIAALTARLPVTCLATALAEEPALPERIYLPLARWMERQGAGPSDGLVPVASTRLPGARHEVRPGGHRALVAGGHGRDPIGLLRAEVARLLDAGAGGASPLPDPPHQGAVAPWNP